MKHLTAKALKIRESMIAEAVKDFGPAEVQKWADNPTLRGIVNAFAQVMAEDDTLAERYSRNVKQS
jgi:hypothetical protein